MEKFTLYNLEGQAVNYVSYEIKEGYIYIDNKNGLIKKRIEEAKKHEGVFEILKTKVKAFDGEKGLSKWLQKANDKESPFNGWFFNILEKAI